jgi:hypothetical protein
LEDGPEGVADEIEALAGVTKGLENVRGGIDGGLPCH